MAARRKTRSQPKGVAGKTLARLEDELPDSLAEFSRRVRRELTSLERKIEKAAAPKRRRIARALRDAAHTLGRYEAEGEKRWRRLTDQARREAVMALRKLERAVAPQGRSPAGRRKTARRTSGGGKRGGARPQAA